jgi:hypothetical protein
MRFDATSWVPEQSASMREDLTLDRLYSVPDRIGIQRLRENLIALLLILRVADLFLLEPEHSSFLG